MPKKNPAAESEDSEFTLTSLDTVKSEKLSWVWIGRIARATLTMLEGKKGAGKSSVAAAVASDVTGGPRLDRGKRRKLGGVIWLTKEESISIAVVPRLRAADADLSLCHTSFAKDSRHTVQSFVFPGHEEALEKLILKHRIVLVILDPLSSFVPAGIDLNREQDARRVMEALARVAQRTKCCFLLIRHHKKGQSGSALDQGLGSAGISAVARSILVVQRCTEVKGVRCVGYGGGNLGADAPTLRFSVEEHKEAGRIRWHGEIDLTADELIEAQGDAGEQDARADAKKILRNFIGDKPTWSKDCIRFGSENGVQERTLRKAKVDLKCKSKHVAIDGVKKVLWCPPAGGWPSNL